ncbi:MAG: 3-hydroxybutyryl-CoA dehydrogenase [Alphaproteobacteria bacterium]|jgi:3-hydroxybutyryl-CoA dehydrogenase|nr:3-hydroxybutyryl-CoA dehydrogenase [Alphaproteobacteria bacterium]MBT4017372.1 3-hydroxybutyryl-CoA dehydrogenase [Alphaproteobacteria bacterium]MBT4965885.1 3-hydroxybutyryl-CoA dehydrogenase [Alphaproteobacteria bacterium]MBT5158776.1 3-hydroxybutyryl-CoA dehydrogenase [Alphaproteobacteria bacterium]MBT5918241.1 3-hydroxybutyryl-CoA dehydrogenase [Alphaproteobacteria bacterium]
MTNIVALGAGRMGRGIAQVFAYAGHDVTVLDFKPRAPEEAAKLLAAGKQEVAQNLAFLVDLNVLDAGEVDAILDRIKGASADQAEAVLGAADYVFEGVPEVMSAKEDALARAGKLTRPDCIIASTTSTMSVNALSKFVERPERFLNAHWLNPAYLIPLVEVSPGDGTKEEVVTQLTDFLKSVGKVPVRCKASPGYIVPRIQAAAMNEAARMVEEGVATAEDIDTAVRVGFGLRYATMGLVEFIDWGGVDILYYACNYLQQELQADRYAPAQIVNQKMASGELGLSHGKGFYDYSEVDPDKFRAEKLSTFVALLRHMDMLPQLKRSQ